MENEKVDSAGHREDEEPITFFPPLYQQRYVAVAEVLRKHGITKVVDFGSAETKIVRILKRIDTLERIVLVEKDEALLKQNMHLCRPELCDHVGKRERPLTVEIYQGDLTVWDPCLLGAEAVSMVEVIEHLEEDVLALLPKAVFGRISPKLVIITTPNADFNVLFPNFFGFRHWDHKFEWTRKEFLNWCLYVADEYNYSVTLDGIGYSSTSPELGGCSQIAVFEQLGMATPPPINRRQSAYHMMISYEYPWRPPLPPKEQLQNEFSFRLNQLGSEMLHESGQNTVLVPLETLKQSGKIAEHCDGLQHLRLIAVGLGYTITEDNAHVVYTAASSSSSSNGNTSDDSDYSDNCTRSPVWADLDPTQWDVSESVVDQRATGDQHKEAEESWDEQSAVEAEPDVRALHDSANGSLSGLSIDDSANSSSVGHTDVVQMQPLVEASDDMFEESPKLFTWPPFEWSSLKLKKSTEPQEGLAQSRSD